MRRILPMLAAMAIAAVFAIPAYAQTAPTCQFILGFKTLQGLDPTDIGDCIDNQAFAPNGDAQQHTTKGLMAWRKADNWTAFTNGYVTWINGPGGLVSRLNTDRFPWEGDTGTIAKGVGWSVRLPAAWAQVPTADILAPGYTYFAGQLPSPSIIADVGFKSTPSTPGITAGSVAGALQQLAPRLGWTISNVSAASVQGQDARQMDVTFGEMYERMVVWVQNGQAWYGVIAARTTSPDVENAVAAYFMGTVLPTLVIS